MITEATLTTAKTTAAELRRRGETEQARAIEALVEAARDEAVLALDLPTSTEVGNLVGVTGQTIKNWLREGNRIMIPKEVVEEYVAKARTSLDLEEVSDEAAAQLVAEGRRH